VATSAAFPGRRIGWADGLDLAFSGYFVEKSTKKSSTFLKINPQSNNCVSQLFCKKVLGL